MRFVDYIDRMKGWDAISCYQVLSSEFIEQLADELDWRGLSRYQYLSDVMLEKYQDRIDWIGICQNKWIWAANVEELLLSSGVLVADIVKFEIMPYLQPLHLPSIRF